MSSLVNRGLLPIYYVYFIGLNQKNIYYIVDTNER